MENLLFDIAETARAIRRAFDQRAASLGITRAQWQVLARIKREPGLRQVELAERLDMEPITLCRIVDRLEEARLVERLRDPSDRRAWRLALTEQGEPLVRRLRGLAADFAADVFEGMDESDLAQLRRHLHLVRANAAEGKSGKQAKA